MLNIIVNKSLDLELELQSDTQEMKEWLVYSDNIPLQKKVFKDSLIIPL